MKVLNLAPGKYVLALSGGVDSMTLLHLLMQKRQSSVISHQSSVHGRVNENINETVDCRLATSDSTNSIELVVAHYNHGIRTDSDKDKRLVAQTAKKYKLKLEIGHGNLGPNASEELARQKRYDFLRSVTQKHGADGIITAHHQDDLIETAFLNILRGTGSRGLVAICLNREVLRPLINVPKSQIITYAKNRNLTWREDNTNQDTKYLRNRVRKYVMPKLSTKDRQRMVKIIEKVAINQKSINKLLASVPPGIDRQQFINTPEPVGNQLIMYWLRQQDLAEFDRKTVERLNIALRTAAPGTKHAVKKDLWLKVDKKSAQLTKTA